MRALLLPWLFACALLTPLSAQVTLVPGSGCLHAFPPTVVGSPSLGQSFAVVAPPCRSMLGGRAFVLLGVPASPVNLGFVGCGMLCTLVLRPLDLVSDAWRVTIPNDPSLVGVCVRVQAGCVERHLLRSCVRLSPALDVCIMR